MASRTEIDLRFTHPMCARVCGPSNSGKTMWVRKFLEHLDYLGRDFPSKQVLWCHGQSQALHSVPINNVSVKYYEGMPSIEEIKVESPSILIIDDLASEIQDDLNLLNLFTKHSHHLGISVIFITQSIYPPGKHMKTVATNSNYDILFNSPRDMRQLITYGSQLRPLKRSNTFLEAYMDATATAYGYLVVNLRTGVPDKYRLYTRVFPDELPKKYEAIRFAPIVYVPKYALK